MAKHRNSLAEKIGGAWFAARRMVAGAALAAAVSGAWAGYGATPLGTLGGSYSRVYGINNAGQVVA